MNELDYLKTLLQVKRKYLEGLIEGKDVAPATIKVDSAIAAYTDVIQEIDKIIFLKGEL